MALSKDLSEFVESLNSNGVEFLIVGAYAVAFHGLPRLTGDIDFLVRPTRENVKKFRNALDDFGFDSVDFDQDQMIKPDMMLSLGNFPNRIDVLTAITGVAFEDAWQSRVEGPINGTRAWYIGYDALVTNKRATGRTKDLRDAEELEEIAKSSD